MPAQNMDFSQVGDRIVAELAGRRFGGGITLRFPQGLRCMPANCKSPRNNHLERPHE